MLTQMALDTGVEREVAKSTSWCEVRATIVTAQSLGRDRQGQFRRDAVTSASVALLVHSQAGSLGEHVKVKLVQSTATVSNISKTWVCSLTQWQQLLALTRWARRQQQAMRSEGKQRQMADARAVVHIEHGEWLREVPNLPGPL